VRFHDTELPGVVLVDIDARHDERGFFARSYCDEEFAARDLHTRWPQCNLSYNHQAHTLRGMHYQAAPHAEVKLVRCTAGAIWDVVVDLRVGSPTRFQWRGFELTAASRTALYIPAGFAHGFLTLRDETEVFYQMGAPFVADAARGFRWDDTRIGIAWPAPPAVISGRDGGYPDLDPSVNDA